MLRIKPIILSLLMTVVAAGLFAQEFGSNVKRPDEDPESIMVRKEGFKPDVAVTLGTSFSTFGPGYNMFGNWIMPEFTFPVNRKFAVRAGIGYTNMFYSTPGGEGNLFQQNNLQYGTVYVSGLYSVNSKVTIAGTA